MKYIVYILIFMTSFGFAQNDQLFEKANSLYNQEKYQEAVQVYQQILNTKHHSVSLYYNKANAHYKLNELAESIYNYEKALQLDPDNEDVINNLVFAKNMKIDKIDEIPTTGFSKLFSSFVNMFNYETWAVLALVFIIIFVLTFIKYSTTVFSSKKRLFFTVSIVGLLLSIFSLLFAYRQESYMKNNKFAIVFAEETQAKAEPKFNTEEAFVLHEGTKVKVFEDFDGWTKIKLTNGSMGWVVSKDIKKL